MASFRFFVYKQKTSVELRISDWSSDVCSSDLVLSLFADDRDQFRLMMEDARGYIWQNDRIAGADDRIRRLEEGPDWEGRALCSLEIVDRKGTRLNSSH